MEINPTFAEAYNGRGLSYMILGNKTKACSDLKRACELGVCMDYRRHQDTMTCY